MRRTPRSAPQRPKLGLSTPAADKGNHCVWTVLVLGGRTGVSGPRDVLGPEDAIHVCGVGTPRTFSSLLV